MKLTPDYGRESDALIRISTIAWTTLSTVFKLGAKKEAAASNKYATPAVQKHAGAVQ